ncbi:hypothetical protein AWZ03_000135 [Drosophila navojoa]|uniref:Uncharacterized protein n=1 Tax=Drosophila navojoa TaxID=7232 RepID=A0A484C029_DRONA|nr:hypothetical protein AWZ03_000135 [Drosophila navojoa]
MYDKSKKTWSQRLKISSDNKNASLATAGGMQTLQLLHMQQQQQQQQQQQLQHQQQQLQYHHQQQQQQQHHPHHHLAYQLPPPPAAPPPGYEFLPSALSRSMKYAEPWIYGTVRGIPARPSYGYGHPHAAAIFATDGEPGGATALAVVICSCAEYLNGTKRDVKKASVCKKCRGSRLPLATISGGGTVRLPAAAAAVRRPMAATMRVVSATKKSRPTILDPQKDPYDLMRRTRLLSPEPSAAESSAKEGKSRSRETTATATSTATAAASSNGKAAATATSMQRGRTRTRAQLPLARTSKSTPTAPPDPADCWLEEDSEALLQSSGLLSKRQAASNSRRSILRCNVNPYELISVESQAKTKNNDDFDVADAQLHEDELEQQQQQKQPQLQKQSQQQQQQKQQQQKQQQRSKFYNNNVAAIAGQRISLGDKSNDAGDSSDGYERIIIATEPTPPAAATVASNPRRPPRNKKPEESPNLALVDAQPAATVAVAVAADDDSNSSEAYTVLTVTPTSPGIKSILKRPTTLELNAPLLSPDTGLTPATAPVLTPAGKSQFYIPTPTTPGTATAAAGAGAGGTASATPTPTSASSTRKKVQFMVEDKIIDTTTDAEAVTATTDDSENSVVVAADDETTAAAAAATATPTATTANYEYYNRKRNAATQQAAAQQQEQQQQQQQQQLTLPALESDIDDEYNFTASAEPKATTATLATHITPDSLHYEDVLPPVHQIFDNSRRSSNSSSSSNKNNNTDACQVAEILPNSTTAAAAPDGSKLLLSPASPSHAGSTATAATATGTAATSPHVTMANVVSALAAANG